VGEPPVFDPSVQKEEYKLEAPGDTVTKYLHVGVQNNSFIPNSYVRQSLPESVLNPLKFPQPSDLMGLAATTFLDIVLRK
jgi:hypothetical protein